MNRTVFGWESFVALGSISILTHFSMDQLHCIAIVLVKVFLNHCIYYPYSSLTRMLFNPNDDALLKSLFDDNLRIEPEWYVPIIPMVLVNGAEGIGTGWSTKVPNYDPREIIRNLKRMMADEAPQRMVHSSYAYS